MGLLLNNVKQKVLIKFPPNNTQRTWNKNLNIKWLQLRDLDTHGSAQKV